MSRTSISKFFALFYGKEYPMYQDLIDDILKKTLDEHSPEKLPALHWSQSQNDLTISLVCNPLKSVSAFFYTMISRWLIPGKNLDIALLFSTQSVSQLILRLGSLEDLECAKRNLPFLEREILIGAQSAYHARKILEMKGLSIDDKTGAVQEKIAALVRRFPKGFDYDIFSRMQHFLVSMKGSFKVDRQPSDISRIIFTLYRFQKEIEQRGEAKRHLCLKLKKTALHTPLGLKEVLSVFVGLNFLNEHELFEEKHLLSALSPYIPVPGSYYNNDRVFYLEIEKPAEELTKEGLATKIQNHIEQLVPPIFMPRNEEEVMRNILILSQQIRYLKDIPQMIISFDEQTDNELSFTVILVRLLHPHSRPIEDLFQDFTLDRVKVVGQLRRKIPKEAVVMRMRMASEQFVREDYSVDLYAARLHLAKEIEAILGEVRDYNGGMIIKQRENFLRLKKLLGKSAGKHDLLLQNFFHSIFPVHLSATLDPHLLRILFSLLLESMGEAPGSLKSKTAKEYLFVMIKSQDPVVLKHPSKDLLRVQMQILDSTYMGYIYLADEQVPLTFEEIQPYLVRE